VRDEEVDGLDMVTIRRGSSTARSVNSDQFRKIRRLRGSKNFINEREKLVLNTFLDL